MNHKRIWEVAFTLLGAVLFAHCGGWQACLRLLHGASPSRHGWHHLLGVESVSGRTAGLDLGISCRGAVPEPVFADPDAARAVATN